MKSSERTQLALPQAPYGAMPSMGSSGQGVPQNSSALLETDEERLERLLAERKEAAKAKKAEEKAAAEKARLEALADERALLDAADAKKDIENVIEKLKTTCQKLLKFRPASTSLIKSGNNLTKAMTSELKTLQKVLKAQDGKGAKTSVKQAGKLLLEKTQLDRPMRAFLAK